jgi:hypothetical protein
MTFEVTSTRSKMRMRRPTLSTTALMLSMEIRGRSYGNWIRENQLTFSRDPLSSLPQPRFVWHAVSLVGSGHSVVNNLERGV